MLYLVTTEEGYVNARNDDATRLDWVGLYRVGAAPTDFIDWRYLNDSYRQPALAYTNAYVRIALPSEGGPYEYRLYQNDGYVLLAATAPLFTTPIPAAAEPYRPLHNVTMYGAALADGDDQLLIVAPLHGISVPAGYQMVPWNFPTRPFVIRGVGLVHLNGELRPEGCIYAVVGKTAPWGDYISPYLPNGGQALTWFPAGTGYPSQAGANDEIHVHAMARRGITHSCTVTLHFDYIDETQPCFA